MNNYKLLALDIDGTLLTNSKKILPETLKDIHSAYSKGVIISISTGRAYPAAKRYVDELNLNIPLILYNGSRIRMSDDSELLFNTVIDSSVCKKVFNIINEHNGSCCFWREDKLYFNKYDEYSKRYEDLTLVKGTVVIDLDDELSCHINKFLWFGTVEELENVKNNILNDVEGIDCFKSQSHILEIVPTNVNKGEAIKFLADYYNIPISSVIAVGDDENDITMIKAAGIGVAMGNAKESVKKYADYITLSNEENGVGEVIKRFIL